MKNISKLLWAIMVPLAAAMLVAASCEKVDLENTSISLSEADKYNEAGQITVTIKTTASWTLRLGNRGTTASDWARLSVSSGKGNAEVTLDYDANDTGATRRLVVILSVKGGDFAATFSQSHEATPNITDPEDPDNPDTPTVVPAWLELPAVTQTQTTEFAYHTFALSNRQVRNYSLLWDSENLVAPWVAYPLNTGLIEGSGKRSDKWIQDPDVSGKQPNLSLSYSGSEYFRGHQLPSADRLVNQAANDQTFYFTNSTPQLGKQFNEGIWATLESRVREWARSSDTLYVVTGCLLKDSLGKAYDTEGTEITVPGYYFKALLWYKEASTYDSKYLGAGFLLKHQNYDSSVLTSDMIMSIDELEEATGLDFFVNLQSRIGTAAAANDVEAQNPQTYSGLWGTYQSAQ